MKKYSSLIIFFLVYFSFSFCYAKDDITVLSINDFHGQVQPQNDMVGAAKLASFIQEYKKTHPNLVIVSAGDNYQGTAISNISHGDVVNEVFDYIGVKYSAIGNHEFDYGQEWFKHWYKHSNMKYLAANIKYRDTSLFAYIFRLFSETNYLSYIKPYGYQTLVNGKTIYFIGLSTLETPESTIEKNIANLRFVNPVTSANKWVRYIQDYKDHNIPKPDTIVLLTHIPSSQNDDKILYKKRKELKSQSEIYAISKLVKGISAILSGHSHMYVSGFKNNVAVVQGESQGKAVSILHYDCHTSNHCKVTPEVIDLAKATKNLPADKKVLAIINKYNSSLKAKLEKVITKAPKALSNQAQDGAYNIPLTYTLAKILKDSTSSDIALINTFGIRKPLPKGDITYGMIYELMPFDNMVVTLKIKGQDLLKLIDRSVELMTGEQAGVFSGVKINLSKNGKVLSVNVNGKPLNKNKYYKLATVDFVADGGDGFVFNSIKNYKNTNTTIRDVIVNYWAKHPAIVAKGWQNIQQETK